MVSRLLWVPGAVSLWHKRAGIMIQPIRAKPTQTSTNESGAALPVLPGLPAGLLVEAVDHVGVGPPGVAQVVQGEAQSEGPEGGIIMREREREDSMEPTHCYKVYQHHHQAAQMSVTWVCSSQTLVC